jgi:hypothetical protein
MKYTATLDIKKREPAKREPLWVFPCFARHIKDGSLLWVQGPGDGEYALDGVSILSGYAARDWNKSSFVPIPRSETGSWRLILDDCGAQLDKGRVPKAVLLPEDCLAHATFPGLFRHSSGIRTLLLERIPVGSGVPGAALREDGSVRTDLECRSRDDWKQVPGKVTITNKRGLAYPRLYSHRRYRTDFTWLRTTPSTWYCVTGPDSLIRVSMDDDPEATESLPDGSSLTLTFTE